MGIFTQIILGMFGILPGNYSGISHIAENKYAIVDDKDQTDGFRVLTLDIDTLDGSVRYAVLSEPKGMMDRRAMGEGSYRDCEGVAFCPELQSVFISGEEDQRILEYSLEGVPTGRELAVPAMMQRDKIRGNLGFEALTYSSATRSFWTTTESTLKADGESTTISSVGVLNRLRLLSFDLQLQPQSQYAYEMDAPTVVGGKSGTYVQGVPSMLALPDGRLLVMEREAFVTEQKLGSFCKVKLYAVTPSDSYAINDSTALQSLPSERILPKKLLKEYSTGLRLGKMDFANYEGMCLGPRLADGRQTLLLIADSQSGSGNRLFRLKDYILIDTLDE